MSGVEMMMKRGWTVGLKVVGMTAGVLFGMVLTEDAAGQQVPEYELPPVEYSASEPENAVSRLKALLSSGDLRLPARSPKEVVGVILGYLGIPEASQVLVFSKTSLQRDAIRPETPRALYYADDAYVGWVPGGVIELAVTDAELGLVFYRVNVDWTDGSARVLRDAECLSCHAGSMTRDWPGLMIRSVFTDRTGSPILSAGTFLVGHDTPISDRWGGWYVTGHHGESRHMGNVIAVRDRSDAVLDREPGANLVDLTGFFDTTRYLGAQSDIVSLMVLEHQVEMHNRLCRGNLRARRWMLYQNELRSALGRPPTEVPTGTALRVVLGEAEDIVSHLLFQGEIRLPAGGVRGDETFQEAFRSNRKMDSKGRSFKDFDLTTHLFKYRCSYMVHSDAFRALIPPLKAEVIRQLSAALDPDSRSGSRTFGYLSRSEKSEIREILAGTLPDFR